MSWEYMTLDNRCSMRIAIIGKQCSGKTSVANILLDKLGRENGVILKFAQPIYDVLNVLDLKKHRVFMQEFSDLTKKHFGNDFFVCSFGKRMSRINSDKIIICDDVRFQDEVDFLDENNFQFIIVEADGEIRKSRADALGLQYNEEHNSEKLDLNIPKHKLYIINNNKSFDDLVESVDKYLCTQEGI